MLLFYYRQRLKNLNFKIKSVTNVNTYMLIITVKNIFFRYSDDFHGDRCYDVKRTYDYAEVGQRGRQTPAINAKGTSVTPQSTCLIGFNTVRDMPIALYNLDSLHL